MQLQPRLLLFTVSRHHLPMAKPARRVDRSEALQGGKLPGLHVALPRWPLSIVTRASELL